MGKKIVIVGGVAGGASAAARLRRLDENAEIIMFERGEYISFANCGLPYYIGGEITGKSSLTLQTPESFRERFNVDVRINSEVIMINRKDKSVTVKSHGQEKTYDESYDKLILSMGAEPVKPPIAGIDSNHVFSLRNIPDTLKIKEFIDINNPKTAIIAGGGYIGIELAENLTKLGIKVTVIEMADQIIPHLDYDMVADVEKHVESKGVKLLLEKAVKSIEYNGKELNVAFDGGETKTDMVVFAIGVRPESRLAEECGLEVNGRKGVVVHDNMLTSDPDIYAVGDVTEVTDFITKNKTLIALAGPAGKQGRIAADNICGIKSKYTGTQGSSVVRVFDMTVATTGINEKTAARLKIPYAKSFVNSPNHATYYPGALNMFIKTIFDPESGKILGAQAVGFEGTDKRMDVMATAIRFGATAYDLTQLELCYSPPYSSAKDPVNMAGFAIENILTGKVKNFHWHDIAALQNEKDVILLDTRTAGEYKNGHISGFINIPLNELRGRLNGLDKSKKVYVTCQVGHRGYLAARILCQHGFDAYNLSGGYRLYSSIFRVQ